MTTRTSFIYVILFATLTFAIGCRDAFHSCSSWSKAGMCKNDKFGFVMRGGCAKTCGFCTGNKSLSNKKLNLLLSDATSQFTKQKDQELSNADCKDLFSKCQQWKEVKDICERSIFKSYMEYGCRKTCKKCGNTVSGTRKATIEHSPKMFELTTKKSLANWPEMDLEDESKRLDFEIGISKEMVQAKKKSSKRHHIAKSTSNKLRGHSKKSWKNFHDRKRHHRHKKSKIRRVEIETGYKTPRLFSSSEDDDINSIPNNLRDDEAVDGFGSNPTTLSGFENLSNLPEFDGASELNDVKNLLGTPKTNKNVDYYTEHFSKDPYVAYSEREEWLKENEPNLKHFRRTLGKKFHKSRKHHSAVKRHRRDVVEPSHKSASKKVVIENGFQDQFPETDDKLTTESFNPSFLDVPFRPTDVNVLRKLPYFEGMDRKNVENTLGKKFDYYIAHFSKDPYLAESEREEWMKENEIGVKSYSNRVEEAKEFSS